MLFLRFLIKSRLTILVVGAAKLGVSSGNPTPERKLLVNCYDPKINTTVKRVSFNETFIEFVIERAKKPKPIMYNYSHRGIKIVNDTMIIPGN